MVFIRSRSRVTLLLVVTVLFGIPRVTAAGYPTAAQVLYVGALGTALVLLSVNIRTLRAWMESR